MPRCHHLFRGGNSASLCLLLSALRRQRVDTSVDGHRPRIIHCVAAQRLQRPRDSHIDRVSLNMHYGIDFLSDVPNIRCNSEKPESVRQSILAQYADMIRCLSGQCSVKHT